MVTINYYASLPEAFIDKGFLENNGIPAVVNSDALSTIYPGVAGLASIALDVPDGDEEKARKLLENRPPLEEIK